MFNKRYFLYLNLYNKGSKLEKIVKVKKKSFIPLLIKCFEKYIFVVLRKSRHLKCRIKCNYL